MSHVVFIFSVISFFTCLSALAMTGVSISISRSGKRYLYRLPFLAFLLLFMLSQITDLYLHNIRAGFREWIYEMQEITMVLMIPSLAWLAHGSLDLRNKRWLNIGFLAYGLLSLFLYAYGNFVKLNLWDYLYPVYAGGLGLTFLYASALLLLTGRPLDMMPMAVPRCVGAATAVLVIALIGFNIGYWLPINVPLLSLMEGLMIPLICVLWTGAFLAADLSRIIRRVSRNQFPNTELMSQEFRLSSREAEVMALLLKGKRYHEIGEALFISKATVKTYVLRIYQKAGVNSKMELANKLLIR